MFLARFLNKMAGNNPAMNRLEQKAAEADQVIEYIKMQIALLKEKATLQASQREEKKLRVENCRLKREIKTLKEQLIQTEIRNKVRQIPVPTSTSDEASASVPAGPKTDKSTASTAPAPAAPVSVSKAKSQVGGEEKDKKKKEKPDKKGEKKEKKQPAGGDDESKAVNVSRLDLRVGLIVTAKKHPDADALYVEEVDVGEGVPRTVVSGLVNHVPIEKMQNRMAVMLCNLKPAKMRGVVSQAMVMCASSPDKVEILDPPSGAVPGDRIVFESYPGEPDKELNPKKKIWEQIQPDLRTNEQCVATYKGVPFEVKGKGICKAQTMSNSSIK